MYIVTVNFEVDTKAIDDFLPLVLENAKLSLTQEDGCHQFDVSRNDNQIFLYEVYEDSAAFDQHLLMPHFRSFNSLIEGMITEKTVNTYEAIEQ